MKLVNCKLLNNEIIKVRRLFDKLDEQKRTYLLPQDPTINRWGKLREKLDYSNMNVRDMYQMERTMKDIVLHEIE